MFTRAGSTPVIRTRAAAFMQRPFIFLFGGVSMWMFAAIGSAFFAGLTSILAKCGIKHTDSDIATAIRTGVVLVFSWIMVFIVGSAESIKEISFNSFVFLFLSGIATGASWICYFMIYFQSVILEHL